MSGGVGCCCCSSMRAETSGTTGRGGSAFRLRLLVAAVARGFRCLVDGVFVGGGGTWVSAGASGEGRAGFGDDGGGGSGL